MYRRRRGDGEEEGDMSRQTKTAVLPVGSAESRRFKASTSKRAGRLHAVQAGGCFSA